MAADQPGTEGGIADLPPALPSPALAPLLQGPFSRAIETLRAHAAPGGTPGQWTTRQDIVLAPIPTPPLPGTTGWTVDFGLADLGAVRVELLAGDDGMQLLLTAERAETLSLLRRHAELLATDLRQSGLADAQIGFGNWQQGDGATGRDRPAQQPPTLVAAGSMTATAANPAPVFSCTAPFPPVTGRNLNLLI